MVSSIETFSEINFVFLVLIIGVRVVEDVTTSASTIVRSCNTWSLRSWSMKHSGERTTSSSGGCGAINASHASDFGMHAYVRCIICSTCIMTKSTRITATFSVGEHRVGIRHYLTLDASVLIYLAQIGHSVHILNLNMLRLSAS